MSEDIADTYIAVDDVLRTVFNPENILPNVNQNGSLGNR